MIYWITYRIEGKQRRESIGSSLSEAQAAEGKRKAQKKEGRVLEMLPESKITFSKLTTWYLAQPKVMSMAYYPTLKINLNSFNKNFGNMQVGKIKPADLDNYQAVRKAAGYSDSYIDQEISAARTMINNGFDNEKVGAEALRAFKKVKKLLKKNSNARDRILTPDEFTGLMKHLPLHTKHIIATAYYTGMRKGEIINLTWNQVCLKNKVIRLAAKDTKDNEPRKIPIGKELHKILSSIPKSIHDNHVFLNRGKPVKDIRDGLKRACDKAGIVYGRLKEGGFVFHDLRHTFNTYMRKAGVSESIIMEITGHSTREMFDRYNTVDMDDAKEAVDQMELYFAKC